MASPYRINLPVYEGPLDLLLDLIRKQEMDIHNIPIAKITEQYLDYLHQLEKLDIDVSADFIYMAATLIHIKSKMLLPADPLAPPESRIRAANWCTGCSNTKSSRMRRSFSIRSSRSRITSGRSRTAALYTGDASKASWPFRWWIWSRCSQQILERRKEVQKFELRHDSVTIAQMMDRLRQRLVASDEPISLIEFFDRCETRNAMIVALLAVLEMVRMQAVILVQADLLRTSVAQTQNVRRRFCRARRDGQIEEQYL